MNHSPANPRQLYEAGCYEALFEPPPRGRDRLYQLGAVAALGRLEEAEAQLRRDLPAWSAADQVRARYFVAVTAIRHLHVDLAYELLLANFRARRDPQVHEVRGLIWLGVGVLRYCYGRLRPARKSALRALRWAVRSEDTYIQFLSTELLAHALLNLGSIQEGLAKLERSQELAKELGRGAVTQAAETTLLLYQATYGLLPKPSERLGAHLATLSFPDSYMKAQVGLESARHWLLAGQASRAEAELAAIHAEAFRRGNRRLQLLHQLRSAHLAWKRGVAEEALRIVLFAWKQTQGKAGYTDLRLQVSIAGLAAAMGNPLISERDLAQLTQRHGGLIAQRIWQRSHSPAGVRSNLYSDDPLGDLIDGVSAQNPLSVRRAEEAGLLGILDRAFSVENGENSIVLGHRGTHAVIFLAGDVEVSPSLTPMQYAFISALTKGMATDEALASAVWNERYNPERHEKLIGTFLSRFKRLTPSFEKVLHRRGRTVSWSKPMVVRQVPRVAENGGGPEGLASATNFMASELNIRQLQLIARLREAGSAGISFPIQDYAQRFCTSPRTAQRDLGELLKMGVIFCTGKGRATRYFSRAAEGDDR